MRLRLGSFDKLALAAWLALAAAASFIRVGLLSMPALESVKLCLFRAVTGVPCPGCGMGHALLSAFQGRWAESFREHPLGLPLLAVWTLWLAWGLRNSLRGRGFSEEFPLRLRRASGAFALFIVFGVYAARLATASDFGAAFDRRGPDARLPKAAGAAPAVSGKPVVPPDLAAAAARWGIDAQIARLAAGPKPGDSFTFAVIGDAEPGRFPWERAFAPPLDTFENFVKEAQGLPSAFILQLGDSVSKGTVDNYRARFKDLAGYSTAPLFPVIGNHDRSRPNGSASKELYEATMGRLDFYFDYGGWRFIGVDTSNRALRDDQLAWLKKVVPENGRSVIFTHVPPKALKGKWYSPKPKGAAEEKLPDNEDYWRDVLTAYFDANSDEFMQLVAERRVARVYAGHIHAFGTARLGPTIFVLSGGGGSPLYPLPPGHPQRKMSHFIEVRVSGDSAVDTVHERGGAVYPLPLP